MTAHEAPVPGRNARDALPSAAHDVSVDADDELAAAHEPDVAAFLDGLAALGAGPVPPTSAAVAKLLQAPAPVVRLRHGRLLAAGIAAGLVIAGWSGVAAATDRVPGPSQHLVGRVFDDLFPGKAQHAVSPASSPPHTGRSSTAGTGLVAPLWRIDVPQPPASGATTAGEREPEPSGPSDQAGPQPSGPTSSGRAADDRSRGTAFGSAQPDRSESPDPSGVARWTGPGDHESTNPASSATGSAPEPTGARQR